MPWILWSALRRSTTPSNSPSVVSFRSLIVSWYKPASSHAFPFILTYTCEAGFSPTSTTASPGVTPRALSAPISPASTARISRPIAVPSMSLALLGNVHRPRLAHHHDLDLPRILHVLLDAPRARLPEVFPPVAPHPAAWGARRAAPPPPRHHAGEPRHFLRVVEDVLTVRGPVLHAAHQPHQLRMHAADPRLIDRLLARFHNASVDLFLGLAHDLLDAPRVDASVGDEALEGDLPDGAPYGIEARDHHRAGGVVDDDVHTGGRLERPDVAALAADDAALHVVVRQRDGRHGGLGSVLDGDALNRQGHDLLRLALGILARLLPDVPHHRRRLAARLVFDAAHQLFLRLLSAQPGDLLEPLARFLLLPGERSLAVAEPLVTARQIAVAFLVRGDVLFERCFPLVEVHAPAGELPFQRLARLEQLFFGHECEALAGVP